MPRGSGRRPKPTKLKELAGNPGKRQLNDEEPAPPAGVPEMPPGLSEIAQTEWNWIVPRLLALGVLAGIDGSALAAYCHTRARWIEARDEVDSRGLVVEEDICDKEGNVVCTKLKRNPAVTIENDALKLMKSFLIEFGLTPASRSRLHVVKDEKKKNDPAGKYFGAATRSGQTIH